MEFLALVWNPVLNEHSDALEKIQCRLLRYVYLWVFQYYPADINYTEPVEGFQLAQNSRNELTI